MESNSGPVARGQTMSIPFSSISTDTSERHREGETTTKRQTSTFGMPGDVAAL